MFAVVNPNLGFAVWDTQSESVEWVNSPDEATLSKSRKDAEDLRKLVGPSLTMVIEVKW